MRVISKLILFILLTLGCKEAYSSQDIQSESHTPVIHQIITNEEGVILQVGDDWIVTDGLQASEKGIFVLVNGRLITISEALETPECWKTWKCKKCGYVNLDGVFTCSVCGKSRYDK